MKKSELRRIVREYCNGIQTTMLKNVEHFDPEWNGIHIRAIVAMGCDLKYQPDCVMAAVRQIKKSAALEKLQMPG